MTQIVIYKIEKDSKVCAANVPNALSLFNPTTTTINCAFLNACVLIANTPFWVKKDPHRCSKIKVSLKALLILKSSLS